jgi:hypothetical protein
MDTRALIRFVDKLDCTSSPTIFFSLGTHSQIEIPTVDLAIKELHCQLPVVFLLDTYLQEDCEIILGFMTCGCWNLDEFIYKACGLVDHNFHRLD